MNKNHFDRNTKLMHRLRDRLLKAASEIDAGCNIRTDSKGPESPYEQMYDRYGVSVRRQRRQD